MVRTSAFQAENTGSTPVGAVNFYMKPRYCVYILRSLKDGKLYIGFSANLKKRIKDHFNGRSKSTLHNMKNFIIIVM